MPRPRLTIASMMLAIAVIAGSLGSYQAGRRADPPPRPVTVYVTRTGRHYHAAGCRYAAVGRAVGLGQVPARLRPCAYCRPPTVPAAR